MICLKPIAPQTRHLLRFAGMLAGFTACCLLATPAAVQVPSDVPAPANRDKNRTAGDEYATIQQVVQRFSDLGYLRLARRRRDIVGPVNLGEYAPVSKPGLEGVNAEGPGYDVAGPCIDVLHLADGWPGNVDTKTSTLTELAVFAMMWRHELALLGIPKATVENLLAPHEERLLTSWESVGWQEADHQDDDAEPDVRYELRQKMLESFVRDLNRYRLQDSLRRQVLPYFYLDGGCGAGEISVTVELKPAEGQLFVLPVFFYKLCQAKHIDPQNLTRCGYWTEVLDGSVSYVAGDYVYLAKWTDGTVRCGKLGFKGPDLAGKTFPIARLRGQQCTLPW